jgi:hypothetical protein
MTHNDDGSAEPAQETTTLRRKSRNPLRRRFGIAAYLAASFAAVAARAPITNGLGEPGKAVGEITPHAPVPTGLTQKAKAQAAAETGVGGAVDRL